MQHFPILIPKILHQILGITNLNSFLTTNVIDGTLNPERIADQAHNHLKEENLRVLNTNNSFTKERVLRAAVDSPGISI